jgi:catechol 2,3-dioxygenase-like lactoylglutathione lyase family enzyme
VHRRSRGGPVFSLHHVQLAIPADGEDRARGFYGELLGLEEIPKPPALTARGGAWFRGGGLEIHLGIEEPFVPARKAHPGILTHDLESLRTRLVDAGVEVRPDGLFPGFRRFYADDCFGNRLEFLQPDP